jgi:Zinc dependent phospholipase C
MKKTKRSVKLFVFLMIISLIQASPAAGWSMLTHYDIVDEVYHSLPSNFQEKLSLQNMRKGSIDPDIKFLDFKFHHYPATVIKENYWINKGKYYYKLGNYNDASYCFGVATHYISDSFCAPHCESDSSIMFHSLYEIRAIFMIPHITFSKQNIDLLMFRGKQKGKESWNKWIINEDKIYIQKDLNRAASASYAAIKNSLV